MEGGIGVQGITDEDIGYRGSRFSEIRDAVFANPYQKVWGVVDEPPLVNDGVSDHRR